MAELFVHPHVESRIIDNSETFVTADGVTQLLAVFTSDIGEDNKLVQVTSTSERAFKYGPLNHRKHGQASYNLENWLQSGGGAYCMRIMPANAGFSHAFLDVQTKVSTKQVKDVNGKLVTVPNTTVRIVKEATPVNNTSVSALEKELTKTGRDKTIDGFNHNFLFVVRPAGRGEAYDDLGFKILLNPNYEDTYDFRVYDFEVVRYNSDGSMTSIDGPWQVAMEPTALSINQESMHIEHVVNTYSKYLTLTFNETAYDSLAEAFNNEIHPKRIDFLTGVAATTLGKTDTFYYSVTGKEEDTHLFVQRYTDEGDPVQLTLGTTEVNYIDSTDEIEDAILNYDNSSRRKKYSRAVDAMTAMKVALSKFRQGTYGTLAEGFATPLDGNALTAGSIKTILDAFEAKKTAYQSAVAAYNSAQTDATITGVETSVSYLKTSLAEVIAEFEEALNTARAIQDDANTINTLAALLDITSSIAIAETVGLKNANMLVKAIDVEAAIGNAATLDSDTEKQSAVKDCLLSIDDILDYLKGAVPVGATLSQTATNNAITAYNSALALYEKCVDKYQLATEIPTSTNTAVNAVSTLIDMVKLAVKLVADDVQIANMDETLTEINAAKANVITALNAAVVAVTDAGTPEEKAALETAVKAMIDKAETTVTEKLALTYISSLQSLDNPFKFSQGSDGDFAITNANRAKNIKNMMIQAFKCNVDAELANKYKYPIDLIIDANFDIDVKNAMVTLVTDIRKDFPAIIDTGFQANEQQALSWRKNSFNVSSYMVGIWTQDMVVYDENTGMDIKVTSPYYLSKMIPTNDKQNGIHVPFVGPKRGTISGYKKISFIPASDAWKNELCLARVNYIEQDTRRTNFATQLTSQAKNSALSDFNNVRSVLRIQREAEAILSEYRMEFNTDVVLKKANSNLGLSMQKYVSNGCCRYLKTSVYASTYDKTQKTGRAKIELAFTNLLERIFLDVVVNQ